MFELSKALILAGFSCLIPLLVGGCGESHSPSGTDSATSNIPVAGTADQTSGPELFADATGDLGIDFVHDPGFSDTPYAMPRIVGSGGGVFDFDNDGRLDLYLLQNGGDASQSTCRLYRQDEAGKFVDVTAGSGLDLKTQGMGFAAGDVDNDGRVDVLITEYGRSRLFLNRSDGPKPKFIAASDAGIENRMWGTSCCFVDYDRDGWLDIVLVNYVDYDPSRWCADARGRQEFCGPDNFPGRVTKLYRNLTGRANPSESEDATTNKRMPLDDENQKSGRRGSRFAMMESRLPLGLTYELTYERGTSGRDRRVRFEDVTVAAGLATHPGPGLGVFCADFSGDRWPDIFVANDGKPNHLWINQKDGTFKEEGLLSGISTNAMGKAEANMGIAVGDVDGNGLFDVFVTHLTSETHTMWMQDTRGFFQDRTVASGVTAAWRGTGFGTIMADFDNNGAVDLALVNGKVERGESGPDAPTKLDAFWSPYAERNQLFLNDGRGVLSDVSAANRPFSGLAAVSRGLICADLDNDGGLDLIVTRIAQSVAVYRNVAPNRGHWLRVRAVDPALHREAYGAEIHLRVGGRKQMSWINPGYSYLCSNDPRAHFGLGSADRYDALAVIWPDGVEESFPGGPADREVVLRRGAGQLVQPATAR